MSKKEIEGLKAMFSDEAGFGDPEARRNAELRLQTLLLERQEKTASQMNRLTLLLVVASFLLVIQIFTQ